MPECSECGRFIKHSGNLERHVRICRRAPRAVHTCPYPPSHGDERNTSACALFAPYDVTSAQLHWRMASVRHGSSSRVDADTCYDTCGAKKTIVPSVPSLEAFLTTWELQSYLTDFQSIGCVDVHDLTTLLMPTPVSVNARFDFARVAERMKKPEWKRLLRVLRASVGSALQLGAQMRIQTGDVMEEARLVNGDAYAASSS